MRTKAPWTDNVMLEIVSVYLAVAVIVIVLLLLATCAEQEAHAEAYLDVAGGMTQFLVTANPGDYIQEDQPHSLDLRSLAYRVELGWRFNERWSVQGGYVNLGTINQTAKFVRDEDFDFQAGRCQSNCDTAIPYRMTDAYHGGELTVIRTFNFDTYNFFLKGGGALLLHRFTINREDGAADGFHQLYGQFPAVVMGAGGGYGPFYVELDYYHGLGGSNGFLGHAYNWPLSTDMLVGWFGVKIPLS